MKAGTMKPRGAVKQEWANQETDAFTVMWMSQSGPDRVVHTLIERLDGTKVRTYRKGHLDARAGMEKGMPRFSNPVWALEWMETHPEEKCLVTVEAASMIRTDDVYAEPV